MCQYGDCDKDGLHLVESPETGDLLLVCDEHAALLSYAPCDKVKRHLPEASHSADDCGWI